MWEDSRKIGVSSSMLVLWAIKPLNVYLLHKWLNTVKTTMTVRVENDITTKSAFIYLAVAQL